MEGNQMKMRDALRKITGLFRDIDLTTDCPESEAYAIAAEALSAPARQCDVGTAEEQAQRFHDFCVGNSSGINGMCKPTCPCIVCYDRCQCLAKWAQMPYAGEGAGK